MKGGRKPTREKKGGVKRILGLKNTEEPTAPYIFYLIKITLMKFKILTSSFFGTKMVIFYIWNKQQIKSILAMHKKDATNR